MGYCKEQQYRIIGNAVCPPLVAALAGAVLDHIHFDDSALDEWDWVQQCGQDIAILQLWPFLLPPDQGLHDCQLSVAK
jgi:hypothetical protein